MRLDPELAAIRAKALEAMPENIFWQRYFGQLFRAMQFAQQRAAQRNMAAQAAA